MLLEFLGEPSSLTRAQPEELAGFGAGEPPVQDAAEDLGTVEFVRAHEQQLRHVRIKKRPFLLVTYRPLLLIFYNLTSDNMHYVNQLCIIIFWILYFCK